MSPDVVTSCDAMISLPSLEEGAADLQCGCHSFFSSFLANFSISAKLLQAPSTASCLQVCSSLAEAKRQPGSCCSEAPLSNATQGTYPTCRTLDTPLILGQKFFLTSQFKLEKNSHQYGRQVPSICRLSIK